MSEDGFLKRWSRRKRVPSPVAETVPVELPPSNLPPQAGEGLASSSPSPAERGKAGMGAAQPAQGASPKQEEDAIDPATLPPLESLGPESDYTVFLRKGVPEAIRTAALRKAWMSDPFIRDFRGPAEYALDYTTSEFDLRPTDDVAKMLDKIFRPKAAVLEPEAAPQAAPEAPPKLEAKAEPPAPPLRLPQKEAPAPLPKSTAEAPSADPIPARRKHGGALPD
jgi:hypothetical protein